jgi:hypothetical protein
MTEFMIEITAVILILPILALVYIMCDRWEDLDG